MPPAMRRNNAPVRPPRGPSIFAGLLIATAAAFGSMGVVVFALSYNDSVVEGTDGAFIARLFSAALLFSGFFIFLMAFLLSHSRRNDASFYAVPMLIGIIAGVLSSALLIAEAGQWVAAPFALVVFTLPGIDRLWRR